MNCQQERRASANTVTTTSARKAASFEDQTLATAIDPPLIVRKKLIDYTLSNGSSSSSHRDGACEPNAKYYTTTRQFVQHSSKRCSNKKSIAQQRLPKIRSSFCSTKDHQTSNKLMIPSFNSFEKKIRSSAAIQPASQEDEERIDFFLKVQKKRCESTKMQDFRAGLQKSRSPKSRLFGSFGEDGVRRSSYRDLMEGRLQGTQVEWNDKF